MTESAPGPDAGHDGDGLRPFDPLRAVTDVQRQAIDNAGRIIGRLLEMMDRAPTAGDALEVPADDGGDGAEPGFQQIRANVARAIDLYMDLFQRTFEAYADLTETTLRRREVSIGGDGASPTAPLTLQVTEDGVAEGELWLHNATDAAIGPDRVGATPLWSHGGHVVPVADVTIEPRTLPPVPPGESARAVVRVDTGRLHPGRYHGHLLTARAALAVDLTVPG
ncbi:MAG: hypothetical protein ACRD07_10390 [Acidimicrobiales bacterium]